METFTYKTNDLTSLKNWLQGRLDLGQPYVDFKLVIENGVYTGILILETP